MGYDDMYVALISKWGLSSGSHRSEKLRSLSVPLELLRLADVLRSICSVY
jgi:hypothetical protein